MCGLKDMPSCLISLRLVTSTMHKDPGPDPAHDLDDHVLIVSAGPCSEPCGTSQAATIAISNERSICSSLLLKSMLGLRFLGGSPTESFLSSNLTLKRFLDGDPNLLD